MKSIRDWCKHIAVWREKKGFKTAWQNVPEKLMLIVTELSEAMEVYRKIPALVCLVLGHPVASRKFWKNKVNEHRETVENFKEELADATIRIFDLAGSLDIDLEKEIAKKMKVNEKRPQKHGKTC
jgi:NTP pyrophosphatase (non-canonical NTP hydrolase)